MKPRINPLISILFFVVVSSLLLYFVALQTDGKYKATPSQKLFAATTINGKLVFKSLRFGVQLIRVDNDTQTFRFRPHISSNGSLFHANTSLGDSIIKKKYSLEIKVKGTDALTSYIADAVE